MRELKKIRIVKSIFFLTCLILYIAFMTMDLKKCYNDFSNYLKYCSILLCTIYVFISLKYTACKRASVLLLIALLFTILADYYLLLILKEVPGLISFCMVQFLYGTLISCYYGGALKSLLLRIIICFIVVLFVLKNSNSVILIITSVYFTNFICNLIQAVSCIRQKKRTPILLLHFLTGLFLFFLCDLCVGIYNMDQFCKLPGYLRWLQEVLGYGMWGFYLPGQVLLATSIKTRQDKE